jgi:hypothetical protein
MEEESLSEFDRTPDRALHRTAPGVTLAAAGLPVSGR